MNRSDDPFIQYRVFRTVRVKIPQTGGTRTDLYRREDRFSQFAGRTIYDCWLQRPFKEDVT